jgi:molecular chaperone GrpE
MSNSKNKHQEAVDDLVSAMDEQTEVDGTTESIPMLQPVEDIEQLQQQLAEAEKRALLAQADLENFRRRTRRDMQDQLRYASLPLMNDLLEAVDNLNRAIEAHNNDASSKGLLEGVQLVAQQISTVLENNGCKKIEAVGQPFDPNLHQAVSMQPSDEFPANTVMQELRTGFQLHERVIRPSQVFVSTGPSPSQD